MEIENQLLVAGTDWVWSEGLSGYPATTYTLKYILKKATSAAITLVSASDGEKHKFQIAETATAGYAAGWYAYTAIAVKISDSTDITPIATGNIEILKDLTTVSDARSHALTMVDNIRTALQTLSSKTMDSVTIEGRQYAYKDMAKLTMELEHWESVAGISKTNKIRKFRAQFINT